MENGSFDFIGLVLNNCQRPGGNGGAFFARNGRIQLDVVKVNNSLAARGAALYLENGSGATYRSFLTSSTATETGGGVFASGSQLDITESNISGNQPNDIVCSGSNVNVFRPIETGTVVCINGCNSALCPAST